MLDPLKNLIKAMAPLPRNVRVKYIINKTLHTIKGFPGDLRLGIPLLGYVVSKPTKVLVIG